MSVSSEKTGSLSANAKAYLETRGLDAMLCEQRLGITSRIGQSGHEFIVFPYMRGDQRVNRKFRRIDAKEFGQDKGGEQIFWRSVCIDDAGLEDQPLIITEGEFDAIAAIQSGYWRTVSVPGGANAEPARDPRTSGKYACVEAARPAIDAVKRIIIAADGDGPGTALLSDLTALLGPARCQFVTYPKGCKDLNDVLKAHGEEGVKDVIEGAKWTRVAGVHKLFDLPPLPPQEIWRGDVLPPIDELITICPGHVSAWTGIPGHGKSSLVNAIAWSIARRDGVGIAHGTFEARPQLEYLDDCTGFLIGRPAHECTEKERDWARHWVQENITFLVTNGYAPGKAEFFDADLEWFFQAAMTACTRHGTRFVILDPWSQIEHSRTNSEPETTYIQRSIRRAKEFATAFNVHVAVIAHPTKQRKLEDGSYAMPEGYDISGSAHWYNGVDLGVTVHRAPPLVQGADPQGYSTGDWVPDPKSTRVLIRVWKKKNHRVMGKPGEVYAIFDSATNRYSVAPFEAKQPARPSLRKDIYD